jgi:hypothetical protein
METIAFLSSLMFLAVFGWFVWLDRTNRKTAARDGRQNEQRNLKP